ncbi:AIPR family protein [Saccharospirillum alexandrii]|uniref:AIPR family protein n=1 Tax=Saccharospirillum alexandrii TaxID=2448477 RepID=UPI00373687C5
MSDIAEYKRELFNAISIGSEANEVFSEESYFEFMSDMLSNAGILDNVEYCPYRNTRKGIRIDGYSWNPLERTICGLIVDFTNDSESVAKLVNSDINDIGMRVSRFFLAANSESFIESLEVTDPGRVAANEISMFLPEAIKIRVVILTDKVLSERVKKLSINETLDKETSIEIWDLERTRGLERSDSEYEEFTVDLTKYDDGVRILPANISEHGFSTFLGVMPAKLLSKIYDDYGQRLLESNVRTFLDFRASTNRGIRKTLVTEPDHFFAYNNGITVTATEANTVFKDGQLYLTSLANMQIVNGGQTTAAIYFSPREKGGIKGVDGMYNYSDIDLERVYIQMKLTVIEDKVASDIMKSNIATYANSQNSIQQSDMVSNHPFHLNIETRSRKQLMPAGRNGFSTKWFYERTRGQYSTMLRALSGSQRRRFEAEYPKKQLFNKTDMAKYENTWRMKPYIVKKGAQANLKSFGADIVKEFEKDEAAFGPSYYNDLVSKILLFRMTDSAILNADWYKENRGLKAELVTYSIALLRNALIGKNMDINLNYIYINQCVSDTLLSTLTSMAYVIRNKISDVMFTGGITNPSEFCKSERGWKKLLTVEFDLSRLSGNDVLSADGVKDSAKENRDIDEAGKSITVLEYVLSVSAEEWELVSEFNSGYYPNNDKRVGIPRKCVELHRFGKLPSDKQLSLAREIRETAYKEGFDFVR